MTISYINIKHPNICTHRFITITLFYSSQKINLLVNILNIFNLIELFQKLKIIFLDDYVHKKEFMMDLNFDHFSDN